MAARRAIDALTITFGDVAENHVGMQKLGQTAVKGLSYEDLVQAKWRFETLGCQCSLVDLVAAARVETLGGARGPSPAHVLIVRGGIEKLLEVGREAPREDVAEAATSAEAVEAATSAEVAEVAEDASPLTASLFAEQSGLDFDKKALFRGRAGGVVKNKLARWNLCFADVPQEPSYEEGKGRVVAFADLELTRAARRGLPHFFGEKAGDLTAEGNYYYDAQKCGIGFHGDAERKIVVALRLGIPIPLHFQWFHHWKAEGDRVELELAHGDLYAMSEKAVGTDWKSPSIPTLRHAAGASEFLKVKK